MYGIEINFLATNEAISGKNAKFQYLRRERNATD